MDEYNTVLPGMAAAHSTQYDPPPTIERIPEVAAPTAATPTAPQPQGPGLIPSLVAEREKAKGGRLDQTELDELGVYVKSKYVMPGLASQKLDQWQATAHGAAFDTDYTEFAKKYLAQPGVAQAAEAGIENGIVGSAIEKVAAVASGLVDMVGGALHMGDFGYRYAEAAINGVADMARGKVSWNDIDAVDELMTKYNPQKTILASLGGGASDIATGIRDAGYTKETLAAREQFSQDIENSDYKALGQHLVTNPEAIITFGAEMIGGIGLAGQATKIPKYAKLIETLATLTKGGGKGVARLMQVLPSGVGFAGQQGQQFEDGIRNASLADLTKNPQIAGLYEASITAGFTPADALARVKDHIVNTGIDDVLATSLIANVILPSLPGLGITERAFAAGGLKVAGKAATSATRGFIGGVGREGLEEGAASAIEQMGLNSANRDPLDKGVVGQSILGATVGAAVGGPTGAFTGRNTLKKPKPAVEPDATDTAGQKNINEPDGSPPAPTTMPPPSTTPFAGFDSASTNIANRLGTDNALNKAAKGASSAQDLLTMVEHAVVKAAAAVNVPLHTLDLEQQAQLIEAKAEELNNTRKKKKFTDLGELIVSWKAARSPAPAPVETPAPAPVAAAPAAASPPESTPEQLRAAIAEVGGIAVPQAAAPAPAPVQEAPAPAPKSNTSTDTPEQKSRAYAQAYLNALANNGPSTGPQEEAIRADPHFNDMRALVSQNKINDVAQVEAYLKLVNKPVKKATDVTGAQLISAALDAPVKGNAKQKQAVKQNKELARSLVKELMARKGESQATARLLTIEQARALLAETDSSQPPPSMLIGKALKLNTTKKGNERNRAFKAQANSVMQALFRELGVTNVAAKLLSFADAKIILDSHAKDVQDTEDFKAKQQAKAEELNPTQKKAQTNVRENVPQAAPVSTTPKPVPLRKKKASAEPLKLPKTEGLPKEADLTPAWSNTLRAVAATVSNAFKKKALLGLASQREALVNKRADAAGIQAILKTEADINALDEKIVEKLATFPEAKALNPADNSPIKLPANRQQGTFKEASASDNPLYKSIVAKVSRALLEAGTPVMALNKMPLSTAIAKYNAIVEKANPSPKQVAPAQEVAGAADSQETNPPPKQATVNSKSDPVDIETRVDSILEDAVLPEAKKDIVIAITSENEGALTKALNPLLKEGDIDLAQAQKLRNMIETKPREKPTLKQVEDDTATPDDGGIESLDNISERAKTLYGKRPQARRTKLGKNRSVRDFMQRIAEMKRTGVVAKPVLELLQWFVEKNPNLISEVDLEFNPELDAEGTYLGAVRIIQIGTKVLDVTTGVHELLHHTERMLPQAAKDKINKAFEQVLGLWREQATSPELKAYLDYARQLYDSGKYTDETVDKLVKLMQDAKRTTEGKALPLYSVFNASEFWAVNGANILSARYAAKDSWVSQVRQWYKELAQKIKSLVKGDTDSAVLNALDSILKSDGKFQTNKLIAADAPAYNSLFDEVNESISNENKAAINEALGKTQKTAAGIWESLAQKAYAFEQEMARVLNLGGKVTPETNIVDAVVRRNGIKNDILSVDESEVGAAIYSWFTENHALFGNDRKEALHKINKFFHNTNTLERIHVLWLQNVKLGAGQAYQRASIMEDFRNGDITPKQARKQVERIVAEHGLENESSYAARNYEHYNTYLEQLVTLKKDGVHEKSMAELNGLMQKARDRTRQRGIESGYLDADDPWVDFYDFKHYVPLKGTTQGDSNSAIADLDMEGRDGRRELAKINKQVETMTGRKSIADNPLEQLLVDMSIAGNRVAQTDFLGSLYQFIFDNIKHFKGVEINVYTGRPKDGFRQTGGKKKKVKGSKEYKEFYRKLPSSDKGFLYHQGDTHYQVILPDNSMLLRGILQLGNEAELNVLDRTVGKGTNILSKLYTTINPVWQTFVALPRDLTYMPVMLAVRNERNPLKGALLMAKYVKTLASNNFRLDTIPTIAAQLFDPNFDKDAYAKANPDSTIAWLRRYEKNGGSTNFIAGYNKESLNNRMTGKYANAEGIWQVTKPWRFLEKHTTNYASLLENIGRVAAFRTLVEDGMTDREAAVQVKDYLNYDQSGTHSRKINSYLQFFKVGMTGADAMRKSFMTKEGKFDAVKLASYSAFFFVLGAAKYLMDDELLGEDEDGERRIKKIKLDTLTQKAVLPWGDKIYGFNIGLGLPQMLLAPGTVMGAAMAGHADANQVTRALYETFGRNAPVRPAGLPQDWGLGDLAYSWTTGSLVPAPLAGVVSTVLNRDAFGRSIHTTYPKEGVSRADQAKSSTSDTWTELAQWMKDNHMGDHYPEDIRFTARTYGGQLVSMFLKATTEKAAEEAAGGSVELLGRVTGAEVIDEKFYLREQTYNTLTKLSGVAGRVDAITKKAKKEGTDEDAAEREFLAATPGAAAQIAAKKALKKAIDAYNTELKKIAANKLSGLEWRQNARKKADSKLREATLAAERTLDD